MRRPSQSPVLSSALVALLLFARSPCCSAALATIQSGSANVSLTPPEQWSIVPGGAAFTQTPGAVADVRFSGTAIQIVGGASEIGAAFGVSIDNAPFQPATAFLAGAQQKQNGPLFAVTGLTDALHTLMVVHAGQRGQVLDIDRFNVEQPDRCVFFNYNTVTVNENENRPASSLAVAQDAEIASSSAPAPASSLASSAPIASAVSSVAAPTSTSETNTLLAISPLSVASSSAALGASPADSPFTPILAVITLPFSSTPLNLNVSAEQDTRPAPPALSETALYIAIAAGGVILLALIAALTTCCCVRRRRARQRAAALEFTCVGEAFAAISVAERAPVNWVKFEEERQTRESVRWPPRQPRASHESGMDTMRTQLGYTSQR